MKIAQVVTFVSADGSFGGPVSVAVAQAIELAAQGHEVHLLAGWDGKADVLAPGVTVKLFRTRRLVPAGFSGLIAPGMLAFLLRSFHEFDVVHIHQARDMITLPVALLLSWKHANYVVQPHGMIRLDARFRARFFDRVAVSRVLRTASSVIAYPGVDGDDLFQISHRKATVEQMVNGISIDGILNSHQKQAEPANPPEVMFMARLHPRKRVLAFADMAKILVQNGIDARFTVIGPDEGDLPALTSFIAVNALEGVLNYEGAIAYNLVRPRLSRAWVYVLPSVNEPFPITVLEAMAVGTPVVITDSSGIAPFLSRAQAGSVTDGSPQSMAAAVGMLVSSPNARTLMVSKAKQLLEDKFSIKAVAWELETLYTRHER